MLCWVCARVRVLAARDQSRRVMGFSVEGGGYARPDAHWGAVECAVPVEGVFGKRCVFSVLSSTLYVCQF
jgi:hypothetical protein